MGGQSFARSSIPTTGIPTLDGDYDRFVDLVGQLLDLAEDSGCAGPMLAHLTRLAERHANHIECLLQRADSDALRAVRRGHEALLVHLEGLQEMVGKPLHFVGQLRRVCGYLLAVLVQDAAAVRRSGAHAATLH